MAAPAYRHEELQKVPRGYRVRSVKRGSHVVRIAFPPGRRKKGSGKVVEILHPNGENNPSCIVSNKAKNNPGELLIFGNPAQRQLTVPEKHQLRIARDTLRMPDAMVGVMGGPNKKEAREIIRRLTGKEPPRENPLSPMAKELRRYWRSYFQKSGLTPAQAKIAFDLHRKGSSPETAIYLAKQRANPKEASRYRARKLGQEGKARRAGVKMYQRMTQLSADGKTEQSNKVRMRLARLNDKMGWVMADVAGWARGPLGRNPKSEFVCKRCGKEFTAAQVEAGEYRRHLAEHRAKHATPRRRRKDRENPDETKQAVKLFQSFHGKDPKDIAEKHVSAAVRKDYAALGDLSYLKVVTPLGQTAQFNFDEDGVKLASSPDGKQLYCIGGNQNLGQCLDKDSMEKDFIDLGEAVEVQYLARKIHGNFEPIKYFHKFGEKTGARPQLAYDKLKRQIFFIGGEYFIDAKQGVSPGIEN